MCKLQLVCRKCLPCFSGESARPAARRQVGDTESRDGAIRKSVFKGLVSSGHKHSSPSHTSSPVHTCAQAAQRAPSDDDDDVVPHIILRLVCQGWKTAANTDHDACNYAQVHEKPRFCNSLLHICFISELVFVSQLHLSSSVHVKCDLNS